MWFFFLEYSYQNGHDSCNTDWKILRVMCIKVTFSRSDPNNCLKIPLGCFMTKDAIPPVSSYALLLLMGATQKPSIHLACLPWGCHQRQRNSRQVLKETAYYWLVIRHSRTGVYPEALLNNQIFLNLFGQMLITVYDRSLLLSQGGQLVMLSIFQILLDCNSPPTPNQLNLW